ncbi:hypothetical protein NDU88_000708 [Pleurodeles waltl]|uniref:Uncharacterized protein n=1 Tax=Pleurodeles waltl TaxID=8319 RepID=A0AAV7UQT1_PLEWA|nr:hypothetical protein NDU88_000708 [Pleurodeles waltl]
MPEQHGRRSAEDSCPRVAVGLSHLCNTGSEGVGVCVCRLLDRRKGFFLFEVSPALRARKNATGAGRRTVVQVRCLLPRKGSTARQERSEGKEGPGSS